MLGVSLSLLIMAEAVEHPANSVFGDRGDILIGHPVVHPAALFAAVNEARLFEEGEVLGNRGRGQAKQLDHLADAEFSPL